MYKEKISAYLDSCRERMVEDVRTLVRIPSVEGAAKPGMPYGEENYRVLCAAMEMAKKMGFHVRCFGNRVMTAELNGGKANLGIIAHLDVVGAGDGWEYPPYDVTVKDGVMYGRGTADDKGPAVAALYAMKAVKEAGPELSGNVRLILGTAEETGCADLAYYAAQEAVPPMSFTPDADYPVIHAEKGMHMPKFRARWERADVLPRVVSITGGAVHNAVPQTASAAVAGMAARDAAEAVKAVSEAAGVAFALEEDGSALHIRASGCAAHVCEPWKGSNAQTALIALLARLPLADCGSTRAVRDLAECFPHGDFAGSSFGVSQADALTGQLVLSFSVLTMDETGFDAQYDCRCPMCATEENMARPVLAKLREKGFEIYEGEALTAGHYTDPESAICKTLNRVYEDYTGLKGGCVAIGGYTYVHGIEGGVAFGCAFPGAEPHFHTANERFPIADMLLSAKMFAQVIVDVCGQG